jgi:predicted transcriptional regulator
MPDTATLNLTAGELAYLIRAVTRDIEEWEEGMMRAEMDDYAALEVAKADQIMRVLRRVEQEQMYTN